MTVLVTKNTANSTMYSAQEPHTFIIIQCNCIQSSIIDNFIFINIFTAFFY